MKWLVVLVVAVTVLAVLESAEARRPRKNKAGKCRYLKAKNGPAWSECDENGMMSKTLPLKPGQDASCEPTRVVRKRCRGAGKRRRNCDYEVSRGECVDGKRTITKTLAEGGDAECDPTITFEKNCRAGDAASKTRCKYNIAIDKNGCLEGGTGKVVITKTPVETTEDCDTPIVKEKPCRNRDCVYNKRGAACDAATNTMTLPLKKALNGATCEPTQTVPCRQKGMRKNGKMGRRGGSA